MNPLTHGSIIAFTLAFTHLILRFHPFTAPDTIPSTIFLLKKINKINIGIVIKITLANNKLYEFENWPIKLYNVNWMVVFSVPGRKYSGFVKSLKILTEVRITTVAVTGFNNGNIMVLYNFHFEHPSM